MNEKHSLDSFISDIDKIALYGGAITKSECEDYDEEYKEVLSLAQLLAKVDYTTKSQKWVKEVTAKITSNAHKDDELEDVELDMVAGGLNLNEMLDEKKKKD